MVYCFQMEPTREHFDEMLSGPIAGPTEVRTPYSDYYEWFKREDAGRLTRKSKEAEAEKDN